MNLQSFYPSQWSIGFKLSVGFVLALVLPLLFAIATLLLSRRDNISELSRDAVELEGKRRVQQVSNSITELETSIEDEVLNSTHALDYRSALYAEAPPDILSNAQDALNQQFGAMPSIYRVQFLSAEADLIPVTFGQSFPLHRQTLQQLKQSPISTQVTKVYPGPDDSTLLDVVVPVRDNRGTVGYIVLTQNLELAGTDALPSLYADFGNTASLNFLPEIEVALLDTDGRLLASSNSELRPFNTYDAHIALQSDRNDSTGRQEDYTDSLSGEEVFGYYQRVPGTSWFLVSELNQNDVAVLQINDLLPQLGILGGAIILLNGLLYLLLYRDIQSPVKQLTEAMQTFSNTGSNATLSSFEARGDEIGELQQAFGELSTRLTTTINRLQSSNQNRIQAQNLLMAVLPLLDEVSDTDYLMHETVRLIVYHFEQIQYAQFFAIEANRQFAVLRAASGGIGRRLLIQKHQQEIIGLTAVGQAVMANRPIYIRNLSIVDHDIPDELKQFQTELVIPLRHGDTLLGVLDIFAEQSDIFTADERDFFTFFAGTIAMAISYKRLQAERPSPEHSNEIQPIQQTWRTYLEQLRTPFLHAQAGEIGVKRYDTWSSLQQQALERGETVVEQNDSTTMFAIPIILNEHVLGAIEWSVDSHRFDENLLLTAQEIVNRFILAVDNARLFEQSQLLIERERVINEISQKLSAHTDIQQILQTAVKELGLALGTPRTQISLNVSAEPSGISQ